MKKFFTLFSFALLSLQALAAWTVITVSPQNDYITFYNVDWSTLKINSQTRTIWVLINNNGENFGEEVSAKILFEIDCSGDRARFLQATTYSESYGKGRTLYTQGKKEWEFIEPETAFKTVAEKVCAQKKSFKVPVN